MKCLGFTFFEKDQLDPSVLVPLSQAKRHETVEAEYARRQSEELKRQSDGSIDKKVDGKEGDSELGQATNQVLSRYTIEGLRQEVTSEVGPSGQDTSYDCEFYDGREVCKADHEQ